MKMERECLLKAAGVPGHQYGDPVHHVGQRCEFAEPKTEREFERRRLRVYVAGPISSDVFEGVHRGFAAGKKMFEDGLAPFIPHADAFWFLGEGNWNAYLEYDLEYVSIVDAVFRLDGVSKGADLECEIAKGLGIPVYYESCGCDAGRSIVDDFCFGNYPELLTFANRRGLAGKQQVHAPAMTSTA